MNCSIHRHVMLRRHYGCKIPHLHDLLLPRNWFWRLTSVKCVFKPAATCVQFKNLKRKIMASLSVCLSNQLQEGYILTCWWRREISNFLHASRCPFSNECPKQLTNKNKPPHQPPSPPKKREAKIAVKLQFWSDHVHRQGREGGLQRLEMMWTGDQVVFKTDGSVILC